MSEGQGSLGLDDGSDPRIPDEAAPPEAITAEASTPDDSPDAAAPEAATPEGPTSEAAAPEGPTPDAATPEGPTPEAATSTEPVPAPSLRPGGLLEPGLDPAEAARRTLDDRPGRSPVATVCPFLRSALGEDLIAPHLRPAADARCTALEAAFAPGAVQQRAMCLVAEHVDCPRYVEGLAAVRSGLVGSEPGTRLPTSIRAAAALVAVVAALVLAAFFLSGGLRTSLGSPSPTPSLVAGTSSSPTPSPTASPSPSPSPSPTASPTQTQEPRTTDPRYEGLARCAAPQTCYIYIAKPTSTVYSIASYFAEGRDVNAMIAAIEELNPQIDPVSDGIHSGEAIKIPPPR